MRQREETGGAGKRREGKGRDGRRRLETRGDRRIQEETGGGGWRWEETGGDMRRRDEIGGTAIVFFFLIFKRKSEHVTQKFCCQATLQMVSKKFIMRIIHSVDVKFYGI